MLPGFGLLEDPALYYIPVSEVANQVACELQEFMKEEIALNQKQRWVVANQDVSVNLNLQTDTSGSVTFTGVNIAHLGFSSLAAFISSTTSGKTSVPSLSIKGSAKRSRTVKINFTISPSALVTELAIDPSSKEVKTINCIAWEKAETPLSRLYLKDWLDNYFATINYGQSNYLYQTIGGPADQVLTTARAIWPPLKVPTQMKIATVELSTAIQLLVDVSGGASPNVLGNGTAFIVPVNGLNFDYSPDFTHTIDLTIKICTNADPNNPTCYQHPSTFQAVTSLMRSQCHEYAKLLPLLSGVTVNPPKDGLIGGVHYRCNQDGNYVPYQKSLM